MNGLVFGLELMIVGFVVVVVTLLLLNFIFHGLGRLFADSDQRKMQREKGKKEQLAQEKSEEISKEEEKEPLLDNQHTKRDTGVSPEVIAVITSALAAYMEKPGYRLKVRRVRRGNTLAPWIIAGRENVTNVYGREIV